MPLDDLIPGTQPPRRRPPRHEIVSYWLVSFIAALSMFVLTFISIRFATISNMFSYTPFLVLPLAGGWCAGMMSFRFRSLKNANWSLPFWSLLQLAGLLLIFAQEGIICLIMSAPLGYLEMVIAFKIGQKAGGIDPSAPTGPQLSMIPVLFVAGVAGMRITPTTAEAEESTALVINATPDKIWPLLFNLDNVPNPEFVPFRAGVAHPTRTESDGMQIGDARRCVLSTGTMEEVISVSDKNRRLRFNVTKTPVAMTEYNPFHKIETIHGADYFWVQWGEFRLEPLPSGRTKLIGTSRYSFRLYPASYWKLWADSMVEQTHLLVMHEIKRRAESSQ